MEHKILKVLHIQMQALTSGVEDYARLLSNVTKTISQIVEAEQLHCSDAASNNYLTKNIKKNTSILQFFAQIVVYLDFFL